MGYVVAQIEYLMVSVGVKRGKKMIQRLLLLTAALAALYCESAFGLGLGGLKLDSALNQEFKAEIELTNTEGLAIEEILPNLASLGDFDRVGVERNYVLTNLRFRVIQNDSGNLVVRVTSQRPIIEPFLNFIVEVLWPNGRILREYTVLLDPPVFAPSQESVEPITPSQTIKGSTQRRPVPPAPVKKQTPDKRPQEGDVVDDEYGITGAGDTLWKIAMKTRPDESVSIQQTMLALQKANPEAFIKNNINLLKAGYVLRIPDRNEIRQETRASAISEVRIQNHEFEDYRAGRVAQLDATRRQSGAGSSRSDTEDGELRLLAADRSQRTRSGDSAAAEALENELAVAQEDLDRARRANTELNVRLDDLAGQLETLNEIVTLKDDQLAALRAQVQKMQEAGVDPGSVASTPSEPAAPQQQGSLLTNPFVLGGLVLLLLAGAVSGLFFMRKKQQGAVLEEDEFGGLTIDDDSTEVAEEEEPEEEIEIEESPEEEDEELAPQTSDAISEAEIYIAYGRFPQAITFLQNAIEAEPNRADIQLKLLEVYVQTEDATAFNLQLEQLKALGDDDAVTKAEEMQKQIPGASENAEAAMEATIISSEPIAAIEEPEDDDDDDFSFDLDDLGSETEDDDLDLGDDDGISLDLDDDGEELDLGGDDLDLGDDDDAISLDLDDDGEDLDLGGDDLDLGDDDDAISLDLDDDGEIDLGEIDLDLGDDDDDALSLDLGDDDDDALSLDLDDDDLDDLNIDDDASTKLDLARAYIDMGDMYGAKSLLQEVISEGSETDIDEANELMGKLD